MEKILKFIKKHWLYILLSILAIFAFFLNQSLKASRQDTPTDISPATSSITYKNVQPGITSQSQLNQILGSPQKQTQQQNLTLSHFTSSYITYPHIAVSKNSINILFIQRLSLQDKQNIKDYIKQFGSSFQIKYVKHLGPAYNLTLYLDQGLAFGIHTQTGNIFEIWYFQPQSIQELELISPFPLLSNPIQYDSR